MGVTHSEVRPHDFSPSVSQLPSIPQIPAQALSLDQIIAGVDPPPITEIFNSTVEGFEVEVGRERFLVTVQRHQPDGFAEDLPESVAFQLIGPDSQPGGHVEIFRLLAHYLGPRREYFAQQLENAANLLRDSATFDTGRQLLSNQLAKGVVLREEFNSGQFEIQPDHQDLQVLLADLRQWLRRAEVSTKQWGKGEAKGIEDLAIELLTGEGRLTVADGTVYLENRVALVWIGSPDGNKRLMEARQELPGGRVRRRRSLGALPAEKIKPDETPEMGAYRLLSEELGISKRIPLTFSGLSRRLYDSQCYPGVVKRDRFFFFQASLPEDLRRGNYKEVHGSKITTFGWVPVPKSQTAKVTEARKIFAPKLQQFMYGLSNLRPILPF